MGDIEEMLIDQCLKAGDELPDRIKNKPMPLPGTVFYYNSFLHLNCDRLVGMEIMHIPTMTILNYANYYGLFEIEAEIFLNVIREIDNKYLKYLRNKSKKEDAANKRKTKRGWFRRK